MFVVQRILGYTLRELYKMNEKKHQQTAYYQHIINALQTEKETVHLLREGSQGVHASSEG